MQANKKSNVSILTSIVAVVIACVPIYFEFFRSIELNLAVQQDAYISNTIGGIPDIQLRLAFRANGPSTKAITVDSARILLKSTQTNETHILTSNPKEDSFPRIIQGGETYTTDPLFHVDDYIPQAVDRYKKWFDELTQVFPEQNTLIDRLRREYMRDFLPSRHGSRNTSHDLDENHDFSHDFDESMSTLLTEASVDNLKDILFFVSGAYQREIEMLDPFGNTLARETRDFSIDEVLSQTLRHRFNVNARIRTSLSPS